MSGSDFTVVGLVLDIVGALLLWFYVVEINFADRDEYLKGSATLVLADPTPEEIRKYKRTVVLSRIAIGLLVLGFVFQLTGTRAADY